MIKKYNQFLNESLLDELKGPSEEELWNGLKELKPIELLIKSAEIGFLNGVKKAIELGADIHYIYDLPLQSAVWNGNLDVVKYLVEQGADIHTFDDEVLRTAAECGYLDIVKYLKSKMKEEKVTESILNHLKGPTEEEVWNNINNMDEQDFINNYNKIPTIYKTIAEERLKPLFKDYGHNALLQKAAFYGYLDGVKKALKQGANIHISADYVLRLSSQNGHLDVVKYLVEHGANIHIFNDEALKNAAGNGHLDIVKYLVEQGADNRSDDDSALKIAALNGHLDVVEYLVEHGADIHTEYEYALKYSAVYGHLNVVKYLVEQGADIHDNNDEALRFAIENNHLDMVKYLKEQTKKEKVTESILDELKGPTKEAVFKNIKNKYSPDDLLEFSCEEGIISGVELAIEKGADINKSYCKYYGNTPLCIAIINNNYDIVKYLIEHNADVNVDDNFPLFAAFDTKNYEIIDIVVKNTTIKNDNTRRVLKQYYDNNYYNDKKINDIIQYYILVIN